MRINIGIEEGDRKAIAEGLSRVLADSYTLYLKTHNYHWNVTGPHFQPLHQVFEDQYGELAGAVDEIAERIRALGEPAPGSYKAFAKLSNIAESEEVPSAQEMVAILAKDHERVAATSRAVMNRAQESGDEVTAGLLTDRLAVHEKTAWMLRSFAA